MSFLELMDEGRRILQAALLRLGLELPLKLEPPPDPSMGDLSASLAFEAAKILKATPVEVAERIRANISTSDLTLIDRFEVAGGGYLNIRAKRKEYLNRIVEEVKNQGNGYGSIPVDGRKILVEHTNSNPNKALHMGTIRNSLLGDAVYRLLKFRGHDVQVVNYIDDSGAQVADNVVAHLFLGYPTSPPEGEKYDHYCGRIYAEVNDRAQHDPSVEEKRRLVLKLIEEGGTKPAPLPRNSPRGSLKSNLRHAGSLASTSICSTGNRT